MDARALASSWTRPYTAVQRAWVDALGIAPSETWSDGRTHRKRRNPGKRELREAMGQRYGVRGL